MTLWTVDEAREAVVASATALLDQASCETAEMCFLLWGAGAVEGLVDDDRELGMRHRAVLDDMIELGYESEAVDELEGISSATGLDDEDDQPRSPSTAWFSRSSS